MVKCTSLILLQFPKQLILPTRNGIFPGPVGHFSTSFICIVVGLLSKYPTYAGGGTTNLENAHTDRRKARQGWKKSIVLETVVLVFISTL